MYHHLELEQREKKAIELTYELEKLTKKLAKIRLDKEQMESDLIALIGHDMEGSKSYDFHDRTITIKTDMIYSLDKKAYENGDVYLPPEFDPILKKVTYEVNKKLFNAYEKMSPINIRNTLNELIEKRPSKPNVTIKVRS
jgi:hypothetical protein